MNEHFLLYLRFCFYNIFTQYDFFHKNPNPTRSDFGQGVFWYLRLTFFSKKGEMVAQGWGGNQAFYYLTVSKK
nr:MAG TPA: hypothetical protein [Caudoviricetes sp.]